MKKIKDIDDMDEKGLPTETMALIAFIVSFTALIIALVFAAISPYLYEVIV